METCINWCEPGWAWMSSDERVWINRLLKLAEERPGEIEIIKRPEENQGVIYCKFPQKWARVRPPKEMHLTDERRADLLKNLQEIRESKTKARGRFRLFRLLIDFPTLTTFDFREKKKIFAIMLTTIRRTGTLAAAPTPGAASSRPGAEAADQALNGYDTITIGFQLESIGKSD